MPSLTDALMVADKAELKDAQRAVRTHRELIELRSKAISEAKKLQKADEDASRPKRGSRAEQADAKRLRLEGKEAAKVEAKLLREDEKALRDAAKSAPEPYVREAREGKAKGGRPSKEAMAERSAEEEEERLKAKKEGNDERRREKTMKFNMLAEMQGYLPRGRGRRLFPEVGSAQEARLRRELKAGAKEDADGEDAVVKVEVEGEGAVVKVELEGEDDEAKAAVKKEATESERRAQELLQWLDSDPDSDEQEEHLRELKEEEEEKKWRERALEEETKKYEEWVKKYEEELRKKEAEEESESLSGCEDSSSSSSS